ncbi:hypothetical protein Nepgr_014685 [Nepenthes gracilis]|uniref:Uncharacterized protein n=1 Tax=Nepenthes gracilis TaxID=150966 RepID=A0AAD3SLC4_NEPGR|nr:hypothetical protein Nepgr_014685 [Nepenthes gracilis]
MDSRVKDDRLLHFYMVWFVDDEFFGILICSRFPHRNLVGALSPLHRDCIELDLGPLWCLDDGMVGAGVDVFVLKSSPVRVADLVCSHVICASAEPMCLAGCVVRLPRLADSFAAGSPPTCG